MPDEENVDVQGWKDGHGEREEEEKDEADSVPIIRVRWRGSLQAHLAQVDFKRFFIRIKTRTSEIDVIPLSCLE